MGISITVTREVKWDDSIPDRELPNSLYLSGKPAFFEDRPWPWVDPLGNVKLHGLPARERFDAAHGITTIQPDTKASGSMPGCSARRISESVQLRGAAGIRTAGRDETVRFSIFTSTAAGSVNSKAAIPNGEGERDLESGGDAVRSLPDPAGGGAHGCHAQGCAGEVTDLSRPELILWSRGRSVR